MRTSLAVILAALTLSSRATALQPPPVGAVSLDSTATRHGTSYETVYQLSLEPGAKLQLGSFELSALVPLSSSATYPTFCCRLALGNATVSARQRNQVERLSHWYELSLSVPSSHWSNAHASSLAATAALMRDAGYYLPDTTTLRAGLGAELDVTPWFALGASSAAHYWLRLGEESNPLLVPLNAWATLRWSQSWSARAGYRGLARLLGPAAEERFLSEVSLALAHEWSGSRLEAALFLPLDASLRELGMLSVGVNYTRSF